MEQALQQNLQKMAFLAAFYRLFAGENVPDLTPCGILLLWCSLLETTHKCCIRPALTRISRAIRLGSSF